MVPFIFLDIYTGNFKGKEDLKAKVLVIQKERNRAFPYFWKRSFGISFVQLVLKNVS